MAAGGFMFKHILMPTDGSDHSERAIRRGIELARLCGARVTGIHVVPDCRLTISDDDSFDPALPGKMDEEARARAERFLAFVKKTADSEGVPCDTVIATSSQPFDAIINTANDRSCDLIVMTSRYRKGLVSLIMGSEATRVLHRASIPVLVFRALMSADHPDRTPPAPQQTIVQDSGSSGR
jgi:nucleotide-binding universal stress UspA family protein